MTMFRFLIGDAREAKRDASVLRMGARSELTVAAASLLT